MPKLELGDLDSVAALKEKNIPPLAKLANEGYTIITQIPSCTLMFRQELPLMFSHDADVQAVKAAMMDPFEYLIGREKDGLLKKDFTSKLGNVSYHIPCHSRVQNVGQKTREMLEMVPDTRVTTVERCSGHAGTWGVKKEFHDIALKIGKPVFRQMSEAQPDYISSDCQLAAHQIEQGIASLKKDQPEHKAQIAHPITLVRKAYGLPDGRNFKATMLIEYVDEVERRIALTKLKGIEDKTWIQVEGSKKIYAIADEDLQRENETKTSAVHFLRFELTEEMAAALKYGVSLAMGVDHPQYTVAMEVNNQTRVALVRDLA